MLIVSDGVVTDVFPSFYLKKNDNYLWVYVVIHFDCTEYFLYTQINKNAIKRHDKCKVKVSNLNNMIHDLNLDGENYFV